MKSFMFKAMETTADGDSLGLFCLRHRMGSLFIHLIILYTFIIPMLLESRLPTQFAVCSLTCEPSHHNNAKQHTRVSLIFPVPREKLIIFRKATMTDTKYLKLRKKLRSHTLTQKHLTMLLILDAFWYVVNWYSSLGCFGVLHTFNTKRESNIMTISRIWTIPTIKHKMCYFDGAFMSVVCTKCI